MVPYYSCNYTALLILYYYCLYYCSTLSPTTEMKVSEMKLLFEHILGANPHPKSFQFKWIRQNKLREASVERKSVLAQGHTTDYQ